MVQTPSLRIVFAGTPAFAVPALGLLASSGFRPLAVLTQPDRRAGRGQKVQASPVKQEARNLDLPVHQPPGLKDPAFVAWLQQLQPDLLIVVAYGLILPPQVLAIPRVGCWNIHASLLPRWRGAAPIQRAIEAGDQETGVCIMHMNQGLDTGDILLRGVEKITPDDTAATLHDRLAKLGATRLLHCVRELADGHPPVATAQAESGTTYAAKLEKAEAEINWLQDAVTLERRVRAFNPWPVAWCDIDGERTRIWAARALPPPITQPTTLPIAHPPGTLCSAKPAGIDIATAEGLLRLLQLQRPGGRQISAAEYLNARPLK